jgi:23S rRNA (adenine2503-C2)-methyltransferase
MMKNLIGLTKEQLTQELVNIGEKAFRAAQIWNWIYVRGVKDFAEMTNIAKPTREILAQNFTLARPAISFDKTALDGTRKWLIKFADGNEVEAVFIPEETRGTLCISSQVGCTLACKFCHTGTQTLVRNLDAGEIVAQIMIAKDFLDDWKKVGVGEIAASPTRQKVTNVVFMGMGEPFYNYENVSATAKILNNADGLNLSARRITISTSGLVPEILRMSKELKTALAISLHATNDTLRTSIMAINKKYPLDELMKACKTYNNENQGQKVTFEYVMLKDVNDQDSHARELISLIKKYNLNAKINIIPFNPWMSCGYERSSDERILQFQKVLKNGDLIAPIRKTRGDDVMAACGQLKSESQRLSKANRNKVL